MKTINPFKLIHGKIAEGEAGNWHVVDIMTIDLQCMDFAGMWCNEVTIYDNILVLSVDYSWNGSNVVPDVEQCILASAIHDALYAVLHRTPMHFFKRWKLRRKADKIYVKVCKAQGMWSMRASIRFFGLRLASPYFFIKHLF